MVKGGKDPHFILSFRENVDIILNGLLCGSVTGTLIIAGGGATRRVNVSPVVLIVVDSGQAGAAVRTIGVAATTAASINSTTNTVIISVINSDNIVTATFLAHTNKIIRMSLDRSNSI